MPNKTIYIADEDMAIYEKAQEVGGESLSKVIPQALRQFVIQKNLEGTELKEHEAWKGYLGAGMELQKSRFIGKMLATLAVSHPDDEKGHIYKLYSTRKGQFLLQVQSYYVGDEEAAVEYTYEIIEDFDKLYKRNLPIQLIKSAEEQLGKSHIRFLDI